MLNSDGLTHPGKLREIGMLKEEDKGAIMRGQLEENKGSAVCGMCYFKRSVGFFLKNMFILPSMYVFHSFFLLVGVAL